MKMTVMDKYCLKHPTATSKKHYTKYDSVANQDLQITNDDPIEIEVWWQPWRKYDGMHILSWKCVEVGPLLLQHYKRRSIHAVPPKRNCSSIKNGIGVVPTGNQHEQLLLSFKVVQSYHRLLMKRYKETMNDDKTKTLLTWLSFMLESIHDWSPRAL